KKFKAYEYQKIIIELAKQYPNMVILKSRQMGITQCIVSKFLQDAIINPAASSIAFMRNGEDASAISRRTRQMLLSIPEYAQSDNDNVQYLKIKGGGDIYFKNSSREGSRSLDSITNCLFDESAFVENIAQIYAASSPSSALSGDKVSRFIVSTPSAKSGWFWDKINQDNGNVDIEQLAVDVSKGKVYKDIPGVYWFIDKANCCKLILHFLAHPIYSKFDDYLAYRLEQDGTDNETVQREYNLRFVDSAVAVFDSALVRKNAIGSYEELIDTDAEYYAGLDCSTIGNDYTVFSIIKYKDNKYSLVHLYRKRQETSEYHIYKISELIQKFKPIIGVEITGGVGQIYLESLQTLFPFAKIHSVRTTGDSKPIMVNRLKLLLEKQLFFYPQNSLIIGELLSFRKDGHKLQAAPSKNDDIVMSVAFALTIAYKEEYL
ncbi:MAG: terminase family protein, partial [Cyanobacteria bacterium J06628_3]